MRIHTIADPFSPTLHAALTRRVLEAVSVGAVRPDFAARFIELLDWLRDHGALPTRKTNEALFKFCQRHRNAYKATIDKPRTPQHLAQIVLFEAIPEWEWKRRHGTYPDTAAHVDRCERVLLHVATYGELPNWDTDRELYEWLRYCYTKGTKTLGPAIAARVETIPGFDWKGEWDLRRHTHGRPRNAKKPGPTAGAAPRVGAKAKKPEATCGSARPPYVAPDRPVEPVRPCPPGRRTPDPDGDPAFTVDPAAWCRSHIETLTLRDDLTLTDIASMAGVSSVAAHHWLRRRTGMGLIEWRLSHGWLSAQSLPPQRVTWIVALWTEAPAREPIKRFAARTGIPAKQVRLVVDTLGLGPAGFPATSRAAA